jgi:GxxExxY protein
MERDPRTFANIGAAMEVHQVLGCGFLEPVYQEALAIEFTKREILYRRENTFPMFYKEIKLNPPCRPDFICFDGVVVELRR